MLIPKEDCFYPLLGGRNMGEIGGKVYVVVLDDRIEILPLKSDLKRFVDS